MMIKPLLAIAAVCLLPACVSQSGSNTADRVVDETFFRNSMALRTGRRIEGKTGIFVEDGVFVVCSAISGVQQSEDLRAFAALNLTANGTVIMRGFDWSTQYPGGTDLIGRTAKCRKTTQPAIANPNFDFVQQRTRF